MITHEAIIKSISSSCGNKFESLPADDPRWIYFNLTDTRRKTVIALFEGLTNEETAKKLNCSFKALANRIYWIHKKFGTKNKWELMRKIIESMK